MPPTIMMILITLTIKMMMRMIIVTTSKQTNDTTDRILENWPCALPPRANKQWWVDSGQILHQKSRKWKDIGKCHWQSIGQFQQKYTDKWRSFGTYCWKVTIRWKMSLNILENATENPRWFLRCRFPVCNLLPLLTEGGLGFCRRVLYLFVNPPCALSPVFP